MSLEEVLNRHIASASRPALRVPEVGALRRVAFVPEVRATNEEKRTITFVASNERVDRYGDVLRVAGWDTKEYLRNPVVLWAHRSTDPPIGKTVSLTTEKNPPALIQTVAFATKQAYPFADQVFQLYKNGFLTSVSVGFRPTVPPKPIRDEETGEMTGFEFNGQELLELSCVPLPANPDAVARAVEAGIVTSTDAERFFKSVGPADEKLEEILRRLDALEAKMAPPSGEITSLDELFSTGAAHSDNSIASLDQLDRALRGA